MKKKKLKQYVGPMPVLYMKVMCIELQSAGVNWEYCKSLYFYFVNLLSDFSLVVFQNMNTFIIDHKKTQTSDFDRLLMEIHGTY